MQYWETVTSRRVGITLSSCSRSMKTVFDLPARFRHTLRHELASLCRSQRACACVVRKSISHGRSSVLQSQMKRAQQKTPKKRGRNERAIHSLARKKKQEADFPYTNRGHGKGEKGCVRKDAATYHTPLAAILDVETPGMDLG